MKLYHGTNTDIDIIDLDKGLSNKDFGKGFYLTTNKNTAIRMAQKKARLFGGKAFLICYDFDEGKSIKYLNIKKFPEIASVEWFLFVNENRDRKSNQSYQNFDIVIGPIADDGVALQLSNFRNGIHSPQEAARLLQDKYLDQQYCFRTIKSLQYLHKTNATEI